MRHGCLHPRRPRICLPLFARSMVCVVGFSVENKQLDCGCCAETATSLATGDQTSSEWEEERQKSRADELRSKSLLRRWSPQPMERFLWSCDSTDVQREGAVAGLRKRMRQHGHSSKAMLCSFYFGQFDVVSLPIVETDIPKGTQAARPS